RVSSSSDSGDNVNIRKQWDGNHRYRSAANTNWVQTILATTTNGDTSGKFLIRRVGTSVTTYYDSGGSWITHATDTTDTLGTGDVSFTLWIQSWGSPP
ncbi:unnamed protein product, partial [marine sediment metagenome]